MTIETANTLHLDNGVTVDSGAGANIRLLTDTSPASPDDTQTAAFTSSDDNTERTFEPGIGGVTNTNNAGSSLFKNGWALRLLEDMTPSDNANCNAFLPAQSFNLHVFSAADRSGGTFVAASYTPTVRASLWSYDPDTDEGELICSGSDNSQSWAVAPLSDMGDFKESVLNLSVPEGGYEFEQGRILLLQLGINTGTVPNPTLGSTNWTHTLRVGDGIEPTVIYFNPGIRTLCPTQGTSNGTGGAQANAATIKPAVGLAEGVGSAEGVSGAIKGLIGDSQGTGTADGKLAAVKGMTGQAQGQGEATAQLAVVKAVVGVVKVAEGAGQTIIKKIFALLD